MKLVEDDAVGVQATFVGTSADRALYHEFRVGKMMRLVDRITSSRDGGEVDFEANLLPGVHPPQLTAVIGQVYNWKITFPPNSGGNAVTFEGILDEFDPTLPLDAEMKLAGKIKVTGPVTFS